MTLIGGGGKNRKIWWPSIPSLIIQVGLLYGDNVFEADMHHLHAYFNSIINTLSAEPFDECMSSIYGHYALFYVIPVKIFSTVLGISSLSGIVLVICLVGGITFAASYCLLDKLIDNNIIYCISVMAFTVISTFFGEIRQYYQLLPHRIFFQALILYGAWHAVYVKQRKWLLWLICTGAMLWNIETGFVCCAASFALYLWFDIDHDKKYSRVILYAVKNLLIVTSAFGAAYFAVNIYNMYNGGKWNSVKTFIFPLMNSSYMQDVLVRPFPVFFAGCFLEVILFMGVLCYCGSRLLSSAGGNNNLDHKKYVFMAFNSLMGLGSLVYFMNHPVGSTLYISHVELVILLAVCADIKTALPYKFRGRFIDNFRWMARWFAVLVLLSLVLDSARSVGIAVDNRMSTTWDPDSLEDICGAVGKHIPEGTVGFGKGVPELYSALNRETGVYVGDWSDYSFFDMSEIDDVMQTSDWIFANEQSFEMTKNRGDFVCLQEYEIHNLSFGLFARDQTQLTDGKYVIKPKLNLDLSLSAEEDAIILAKDQSNLLFDKHVLVFDNNMALDIPGGVVDDEGRVQTWERNDTLCQKWCMKEIDGYYMIYWDKYALTYDLNDNSVKLAPMSGGDDQLWEICR